MLVVNVSMLEFEVRVASGVVEVCVVALDKCSSSCLMVLLRESTSRIEEDWVTGVEAVVEPATSDCDDDRLGAVDALLVLEAVSRPGG